MAYVDDSGNSTWGSGRERKFHPGTENSQRYQLPIRFQSTLASAAFGPTLASRNFFINSTNLASSRSEVQFGSLSKQRRFSFPKAIERSSQPQASTLNPSSAYTEASEYDMSAST